MNSARYIVDSLLVEAPPDIRPLYNPMARRLTELWNELLTKFRGDLWRHNRPDIEDTAMAYLRQQVRQDPVLAPYLELVAGDGLRGVSGEYRPGQRKIFMRTGALEDMLGVLRHELVHLYQHQRSHRNQSYSNAHTKQQAKVNKAARAYHAQGKTQALERAYHGQHGKLHSVYMAEPIEAQARGVDAAASLSASPQTAAEQMRHGGPLKSEFKGVNPKAYQRYLKNMHQSYQQRVGEAAAERVNQMLA